MGGLRIRWGLLLLMALPVAGQAMEPVPAETLHQQPGDAPIVAFQDWLDRWMRNTRGNGTAIRDAAPADAPAATPRPGLDLRINPDDESVFLGWRARF